MPPQRRPSDRGQRRHATGGTLPDVNGVPAVRLDGPFPRLRIAQVAPPIEAVPPPGYGGIERVVDTLTEALVARGHEVTLFASGDSTSGATHLVPTLPKALRSAGDHVPPWPFLVTAMLDVVRRAPAFDVVQRVILGSHLGVARRLISETTATNALGEGKTRDESPLDQPAPFVSLLVAQFHYARTHRIELFIYIAFEKIKRLM